MQKFSSQRGYTLLFAILTATLVLGVTVFILSVSRKQFALSATARDSMTAFYAADAGIECAALIASSIDISQTNPGTITCNGQTVVIPQGVDITTLLGDSVVPPEFNVTGDIPYFVSPSPFDTEQKMYLSLKGKDGSSIYGCVLFTIYQGIGSLSGSQRTVIEVRGYNLCDDGAQAPDTTSVRTVERGLQLIRQ